MKQSANVHIVGSHVLVFGCFYISINVKLMLVIV